ncbi:MAG: DNA polymerase I [bacterium]|nr:DNA polymerase I [bacterium]
MNQDNKLFIVDGHSLIYKAFYAIKSLTNSKGEQTNAVYGFTSMILKLLSDQNPSFLIVVFDSKTPTFRHEQYKEYKMQRKKMPCELKAQIPLIMKVLTGLGISYYSEDGFEADDVMGTLAKKYHDHFNEIILVANDKDILQLVNKKVKVCSAKKGISEIIIYDEEEVKRRYGISPSQIQDMLSLMGDSSDNIPGIPGVGEKTAVKLIQSFGSFENLIKHIEEVTPLRIKEKIKTHLEQGIFSKKLVTIDTEVPLKISIQDLEKKNLNHQNLKEIFSYLEFYSFLEKFGKEKNEPSLTYQKIKEVSEFLNLKTKILKERELSFFILASCIDVMQADLLGITIGLKDKSIYLIPSKLFLGDGKSVAKEIFIEKKIIKFGHNLKKSMILLKKYDIEISNYFDLMIASYLLRSSITKHSLENMAAFYLNEYGKTYSQYLEKTKEVSGIESEEVKDYICQEISLIVAIKNILIDKLKEESLEDVFYHIELPLVKVLSDMEYAGIKIDIVFLREFSHILQNSIKEISGDIYAISREEFNINSSKQLSYILFEKLRLPMQKKIKTGYSTDEKVLMKLSQYHELPLLILRYRELSKLFSTYVEALPKLVNKKSGRLHTSYNQTGTLTGRLSSSNPNLQNIPIKSELGRRVRYAFIPEKDKTYISADYSQIELRILAHFSQDETLIDAFKQDQDIHQQTATNIFNVALEKVTNEMRRFAKIINFGIIYGMSAFGLSEELKITPAEAQSYIEIYFRKYSGIKRYIEETIEKASIEGFVATIWGRKRFFPEINSLHKQIREQAIRMCINTPIQGSAADLIKLAMINLAQEINNNNLESKMLLQIHDELILEVPQEELSFMKNKVKEIMENAAHLLVPLKVNIKIGDNGYEVLK